MKTYKVFLKSNELGKTPYKPTKIAKSLEEAKNYCNGFFASLGDSQFCDESIDGVERFRFYREFSADSLGLIECEL